MIKIILLTLLFLIGCAPSKKTIGTGIDFNEVLMNENLTDSEKLVELQIQISRQEDQILRIQNKAINLENSFELTILACEIKKIFFEK